MVVVAKFLIDATKAVITSIKSVYWIGVRTEERGLRPGLLDEPKKAFPGTTKARLISYSTSRPIAGQSTALSHGYITLLPCHLPSSAALVMTIGLLHTFTLTFHFTCHQCNSGLSFFRLRSTFNSVWCRSVLKVGELDNWELQFYFPCMS